MDHRGKISEIEAEARRIAAKRNWVVIIAEVCVIFLFPLIISILIQNMNELNKQGIFWSLILMIGGAQLLLGLLVLFPAKNEFFYFDHLDLKKDYERLESNYRRAEYTGRVVYHMLENLQKFIKECESADEALTVEKIRAPFEKLMQTPITFREGVLGFTLRDRYSFVVYLYSVPQDLLKPFYSSTDIRFTSALRDWKPYKGSIGACFAEQKIIFVEDLTESPDWHVYYKPGDERNYRSLVAAPILNLTKKDSTVRGVLVVTSSAPTHFDVHIYTPIFTTLTTILAVFFRVADSKLPEEVDYI
jgi:hypothetical protein